MRQSRGETEGRRKDDIQTYDNYGEVKMSISTNVYGHEVHFRTRIWQRRAKEADIRRTYRIATITRPLTTSIRPNVYAVESHFRHVEDVR